MHSHSESPLKFGSAGPPQLVHRIEDRNIFAKCGEGSKQDGILPKWKEGFREQTRVAYRRRPVPPVFRNIFQVDVLREYRSRCFLSPVRDARKTCLLYTSDAADERSSVDLGGRRIIKKKK